MMKRNFLMIFLAWVTVNIETNWALLFTIPRLPSHHHHITYSADHHATIPYISNDPHITVRGTFQVLRAGTSNYIPHILWAVITCPCPWHWENFSCFARPKMHSWKLFLNFKYNYIENFYWSLLCLFHWSSYFLTHLPLDKMVAISQTIFSNAFSWMKMFVFWLKFHWSLFLRVRFTISQHWFR